MNHEVQVCFEEAFVEENDLRHTRSLDVNHLRGTRKSFITGMTDYFRYQTDSLTSVLYRKTTDENDSVIYVPATPTSINGIYVSRKSMDLSEGIRLYRAYGTQQLINERPVAVPPDMSRMDSLFHSFFV